MGLTNYIKRQIEYRQQARLPERKEAGSIVRRVLHDRKTYLSPTALFDLAVLVRDAESKHMEGIIVEAGCALGGSAIVIASSKSKTRPFYIYDTFGMIPPPSERDAEDVHARYAEIVSGKSKGIGRGKYYGYEENLQDKISKSFNQYGYPSSENSVHLVKGLFQDTITGDDPVAIAHIDCDWYDSVKTCLGRLVPRLVHGGTLVFDDYGTWSGCRNAVDDFFATRQDDFIFTTHARLHVTKR